MKRAPNRSYADALGKKPPERLSEYFDFQRWPEKGGLTVKRNELLAILTQMQRGREAARWHRRVWRWLTTKLAWKHTALPPESTAALEANVEPVPPKD